MAGSDCSLCRQPFGLATETTAITLGGKRFLVHSQPCAKAIADAQTALGRMALSGLQAYLQKKSPLALTAVRIVAKVLARPKELPSRP